MVTICYKNEKNPSKLAFLQDFRFYQWSTHNEKINTSKTNCHCFQNWQLKWHLSQKIAQFLPRSYTKCNVDFTRKMTLAQNIAEQNDILNHNNNFPTNEIL